MNPPTRIPVLVFLLFAACMALLAGCIKHHAEPLAQHTLEGPHREALVDTFRAQGRMLYVYGSGDSTAAGKYRGILAEVAAQSRRTQVIFRSDREVTDAELHAFPLFLFGTPATNTVLKRLMPQLPLNVTEKTVQFNQQQYGAHPVLSLGFFPNPLAPTLPLSLITATTDDDILNYIQERYQGHYGWLAFGGWGYELHDGGRRKVMGFFDETDPKQWKIGGKTHWDFSHDGQLLKEQNGFSVFDHQCTQDSGLVDSILAQLSATRTRISSLFNLPSTTSHFDIHLYPSLERKGLATGNTRPASISEDGRSLHLLLHPEFAGREWPESNLMLLRSQFPKLHSSPYELGFAVWLTSRWEKQGWKHWAAKLANGGNALRLAEIFDAEAWAHESPYLKGCMAAALVDWLLQRKQIAELKAQLQAANPGIPSGLTEVDWKSHLLSLAPPSAPQPMPPLPAYHKAFNFAHEGYQIFNGYASTEATASMRTLADDLHSNSVALIPYAGYQDVHAPSWLDFSDGAGAESDESIIHSIWSARQAGLAVMLKPQVWPWNSWTGEVAMQDEAAWQQFFDHYFRWIRHYAIMAEMYDVPVLCVGVEFVKATIQRPDDWRAMIGKLRPIYSGKLTYAANWGDEFENCKFWDALDFIGINCYYPLSKSDKPSQKDLDQGFAAILDKVEAASLKARKPVLFTEIGFRTVERSWQNPHAEADGRKADNAAQEMCYRAMIKGLQGRDWCQGVYLWKWPAYMEDAKYDLQGFTPLGRPSAQLVREWFGGM